MHHVLPLLLAVALAAQPAKFEVATVKFSTPTPGRSAPTIDPLRLAWRGATIKRMICEAYNLQSPQIIGAPPWTDTERYDIEAKPDHASTRAEMREMLQSLLAERFHLTIQKQKKTLPVYVLSTAKGGPRLTATTDDGSSPTPVINQLRRRASMAQLAGLLSQMINGPIYNGYTGELEPRDDVPTMVIDGTNLSGIYEISLDLTGAATDFAATISHALAPLGLKLDHHRTEVDILSVTHIERIPTAN